jgi:hypothetical protein
MNINGLGAYNNQIYSPLNARKTQELAQEQSEKQNAIHQSVTTNVQHMSSVNPISQLNLEEKSYFQEAYANQPFIQQYLKTGSVQGFASKGQVVDFRG